MIELTKNLRDIWLEIGWTTKLAYNYPFIKWVDKLLPICKGMKIFGFK